MHVAVQVKVVVVPKNAAQRSIDDGVTEYIRKFREARKHVVVGVAPLGKKGIELGANLSVKPAGKFRVKLDVPIPDEPLHFIVAEQYWRCIHGVVLPDARGIVTGREAPE